MDSSEADVVKEGVIMISKLPAPMESVVEEVPGLSAIKPKVGDPIKNVEAALPILMKIENVGMAQAVALLTLHAIMEEELLVAEL